MEMGPKRFVDRNDNANKKGKNYYVGSSVIVQTIECLLIQSHVKFFLSSSSLVWWCVDRQLLQRGDTAYWENGGFVRGGIKKHLLLLLMMVVAAKKSLALCECGAHYSIGLVARLS